MSLLSVPGVSLAEGAPALPVVRIGILTDGSTESIQEIRGQVKREILALTEGELDVRFPASSQREGDWTLVGARRMFRELLADPELDLVINLGVLASQAACCQDPLPKPVIAPIILDGDLQRFPFSEGTSGVHNLAYLAFQDTLSEELAVLRRVVPFEKVAIVANGLLVSELPEIIETTSKKLASAGIAFEYISAGRTADEVLAAIPDDADAVYVWPQFQMSSEENQRLIDGLKARRLPGFASMNIQQVNAGMLATNASANFLEKVARRIALDAQAIVLGQDAGTLPVTMEMPLSLVVNMQTAREIGIPIRWDVLIEATTIHGDLGPEDLPQRTLAGVVRDALATNLDLRAFRQGVASSAQEILRARGKFLPRVDLSTTRLQIDADRAAASFGSQAERSLTASGTVSQLIYSDAAFANLGIQRDLQLGREQELQALRLDIIREAALSFLDVLRAKTLVRIQRSNLESTRAHLELAETRRLVGSASQSEVLRWQSEIATARKELVDAIARQQAAEITLNRMLHRPLSERFFPVDVDLSNPDLVTGQEGFYGYIETPEHFRVLQDFVVRGGLEAAPELQKLRATVHAQELSLRTARRAFWVPSMSFQGSVDERLSRSGSGAEAPLGLGVPPQDDTNWSVALIASLPLFTGRERQTQKAQATETLAQLKTQLASSVERVEQRIRIAMTLARASHTGIDLSREAATAAAKNLELVTGAYARGAVSIIDLLDAQNAAFSADQQAANAAYDFLVDLMEVERAASRFGFLVTGQERVSWHEELDAFFRRAGLKKVAP